MVTVCVFISISLYASGVEMSSVRPVAPEDEIEDIVCEYGNVFQIWNSYGVPIRALFFTRIAGITHMR